MNAAYVHLTLNHVPVLGVVFALPLLGFGLLRRNPALLRAGWVTLVAVALVAIPVYLSGEGAEEIVEDGHADAILWHLEGLEAGVYA